MLRFILIFVVIFLLSLGLRFWNLGQFNTLVFDEVYYAKFANHYLIKTNTTITTIREYNFIDASKNASN